MGREAVWRLSWVEYRGWSWQVSEAMHPLAYVHSQLAFPGQNAGLGDCWICVRSCSGIEIRSLCQKSVVQLCLAVVRHMPGQVQVSKRKSGHTSDSVPQSFCATPTTLICLHLPFVYCWFVLFSSCTVTVHSYLNTVCTRIKYEHK